MADLCDRYLAEHVEVHNKPRTRAENRRMVEQIIKPKLGRLKVEAVDHEDVDRLHRELKRTPRQANHVVAVLSQDVQPRRALEAAPAQQQSLPAHRALPRDRARPLSSSADELERIGAAMREMETEGRRSDPKIATCIRFLALVGCRLNEAVALDLGDDRLRTGAWTLPDAKAGARTVMLGAPALALLAVLARTEGRAFVREDGRPVTVNMIERAWIGEGRNRGTARSGAPRHPGPGGRAGLCACTICGTGSAPTPAPPGSTPSWCAICSATRPWP